MYTPTPQELASLFKVLVTETAAVSVPGGTGSLRTPTGESLLKGLFTPEGSAFMSFSGVQIDPMGPTSTLTFAQVFRAEDDEWTLRIWRVQEGMSACVQTMHLGTLDDEDARIRLYPGSLRGDTVAFSIHLDEFSVVMVANWREVGDDEESYEGKIFPRIGSRQQFDSLTLVSDSRILLTSASGQLTTINYAALPTSIYPEYDGSVLEESEVSHVKERPSARTVDASIVPPTPMPAHRAVQCQ